MMATYYRRVTLRNVVDKVGIEISARMVEGVFDIHTYNKAVVYAKTSRELPLSGVDGCGDHKSG